MGDRYDFELTVNLREDTPDEITAIIAFLTKKDAVSPSQVPNDPFFSDYWKTYRFIDWVASDHPNCGAAVCSFERVYRYTHFEVDHFQYTLHLRFRAKLEPIAEVAIPFAMWIAKWSDQSTFVGYFIGPVADHPTLLYIHKGELYLREPTEPPQRVTDGAPWDKAQTAE